MNASGADVGSEGPVHTRGHVPSATKLQRFHFGRCGSSQNDGNRS
jgi:hypothetical protein